MEALTARAQQIIKEAADNSTRVTYTRIEVNGYTDTSGTARYNQGLSIRLAQAVAALSARRPSRSTVRQATQEPLARHGFELCRRGGRALLVTT